MPVSYFKSSVTENVISIILAVGNDKGWGSAKTIWRIKRRVKET